LEKEKKIGCSRARNRIIREARGKIISFFDDDERVDRNYLHGLKKAFSDPTVDMVCGRILLDYEGERPVWIQHERNEMEGFLSRVDAGDQAFRIKKDDFVFSTGNLAFVRKNVERWGYFDVNLGRQGKKLIGGEDVKFCKAALCAGAHIRYEPDMLVYHIIPKYRATKQHLRKLRFFSGMSNGRIEKRKFKRHLFGIPLLAFRQMIPLIIKYLRLALSSRRKNAFRQQLNIVFHIGWMYGLWRKWCGDALIVKR
jgi:GT2 family glycosyltransferase